MKVTKRFMENVNLLQPCSQNCCR